MNLKSVSKNSERNLCWNVHPWYISFLKASPHFKKTFIVPSPAAAVMFSVELPATRYLTNWKPVPASFLFVSLISMHIKTSELHLKLLFVRIFHLLIHQLFRHPSAAALNMTIIPLVRSFHIIVTSQSIYCLPLDTGVCVSSVCVAAANVRKYSSEWWITMQRQNLHTFHHSGNPQEQTVHPALKELSTRFKNMNKEKCWSGEWRLKTGVKAPLKRSRGNPNCKTICSFGALISTNTTLQRLAFPPPAWLKNDYVYWHVCILQESAKEAVL